MNVELYEILKSCKLEYNYFHGELHIHEIKKFVDEKKNEFSSENKEFSEKDIDLLTSFLLAQNEEKFLLDYFSKEYANMESEKVLENVMEFFNYNIVDRNIIDAMLDKKLIFENFDKIKNKRVKEILIDNVIKYDEVFGYINGNGKNKEEVIKICSALVSDLKIIDTLEYIDSDVDRAKFLLFNRTERKFKTHMLPYVKSTYLRTQLVKPLTEYAYAFSTEELLQNINKYGDIRKQFDELKTEEEKTKFILNLKDIDCKLEFLNDIKIKENRNAVINSLENKIDPTIKPQVELVQTMIREYFEDTLGNKFDEDKEEKMQIVFNKTNVFFKDLDPPTNATTDHLFDTIEVSDRHKYNNNNLLGFLIHEYEHAFSNYNFKNINYINERGIEEGTADLFADLVINHYIEKHKKVELEGKKIRVDYPYTVPSGYDFENAWQRTILYGMQENNKDKEAMAEYILGNKCKYLEMVLGKNWAMGKRGDGFGNPEIILGRYEIYNSPNLNFSNISNIDKNSIYAKRNFILPLFELQNRLNEKGINIIDDGGYLSTFIGKVYFDDRKIYEISREEMEEFKNLVEGQIDPIKPSKSVVVDIDDFYNQKHEELSQDEINENSFEILNTSIAMWSEKVRYGRNVETLLTTCLRKEIELVEEGQSLQESLEKYVKIIPDYLQKVNPTICDSNQCICEAIKNLKFAYLGQIRDSLEKGNEKEVLKSLAISKGILETKETVGSKDISEAIEIKENTEIKEESGAVEIYLDEDIMELFNEYNIHMKYNSSYSNDNNRNSIIHKNCTNNGNKKSGLQDVMNSDIIVSELKEIMEVLKKGKNIQREER